MEIEAPLLLRFLRFVVAGQVTRVELVNQLLILLVKIERWFPHGRDQVSQSFGTVESLDLGSMLPLVLPPTVQGVVNCHIRQVCLIKVFDRSSM